MMAVLWHLVCVASIGAHNPVKLTSDFLCSNSSDHLPASLLSSLSCFNKDGIKLLSTNITDCIQWRHIHKSKLHIFSFFKLLLFRLKKYIIRREPWANLFNRKLNPKTPSYFAIARFHYIIVFSMKWWQLSLRLHCPKSCISIQRTANPKALKSTTENLHGYHTILT